MCKETLMLMPLDGCMAILGSPVHWRDTFIVSRIFVSPRCKEHLQDLCMAILGSKIHWRDIIIGSRIFVSSR